MKICIKCGQEKELTEFYKNKRYTDGHYGECKICYKIRANNNHLIRKYIDPVKTWFLHCKNRAKSRGIEFIVTLEEIHSIWTGKCEESGVEFTFNNDSNSPTMDRLNPGGIYQIDNIRIVTSYVNAKRGRKLLEEGWRGVYAN